MMIDKAMEYCRNILKGVSRSFSLTIPLVEKNILVPILVGYLEARIIDSFEDENPGGKVSGEERMRNINNVISIIEKPDSLNSRKAIEDVAVSAGSIISNPHYLDLAQNIGKVIEVHRTMDKQSRTSMSLWLGKMAEGMQKYLHTRIDNFDQLDEYCYYVGGTVGGLLTDILVRKSAKTTESQVGILRSSQNDFGLFLQKVNIIRDFRQDILSNEKIFWPYEAFQKYEMTPKEAILKENEDKAMKVLGNMIDNTDKHILPVMNYINAIPEDFPGFRKASSINFLMGVETLKKVRGNPDVFFSDTPVKIGRDVRDSIISDPESHFAKLAA